MTWRDIFYVGDEPKRSHSHDVGFDLKTTTGGVVAPHSVARFKCGIKIAIPDCMFGWVVARSSTIGRRKLMVMPGVIDPGWRGEMQVVVWNPTPMVITILEGERLAQLILLPNLANEVRWRQVEELPPGERETRGFGSTGRV